MLASRIIVLTALCSGVPTVAHAQSGALDMGQLTGTLSQDAVTQSEERRAARQSDREQSRARTRANCAKLPRLRARYGADDPRIVAVGDMCRRLGY